MDQKIIIQNIQISQDKSLSLCIFNEQQFFVISSSNNNKKFINIPDFIIKYTYDPKTRILNLNGNASNSAEFTKFCLMFSSWSKNVGRVYRKKLILKGLGYKVNLIKNNSILELKLGFSHSIFVTIPIKDIVVRINKQNITIEGMDSSLVGNFANKIRQLKLPDSYKGKGIWYQNEVRVLKELKKK